MMDWLAIKRARQIWHEGKTLGEVAKVTGYSVEELFPWLVGDRRIEDYD